MFKGKILRILLLCVIGIFPHIAHCIEVPGKALLSGKTFTAKQVIVSNFFGNLTIRDQPGSYIGIKIKAENEDVAGIRVLHEQDLLTFEGDGESYIIMEVQLDPSTPLEINIASGTLSIEDRTADTTINLKSTTAIMNKMDGNIVCEMRGKSKLDIQELKGNGMFNLEDSSAVRVFYGQADDLTVNVRDNAIFNFSGSVNENFIYSAQNFGKIYVQSVAGKIQRRSYSRNAGVYINLVLEEVD